MSQSTLGNYSLIIKEAGALAAWASTAWSPWKGKLGEMNLDLKATITCVIPLIPVVLPGLQANLALR